MASPVTIHVPPPETGLATRALAQASLVACVFFGVAGLFEAALIRALRPSALELDWVSDAVLSAALGVAVYLWLHLRATRRALTERERSELVLETQLSLAEAMQRRLLPTPPAPADGLDWAAVLTPAGKIGGDLYDFVETAPGDYLVLLADVSGKGIAAAMALTLVRSTFRHVARETRSPAQVAARMSMVFYDEWRGAPYVTGIVARLEARDRVLTCTNAGHPPAVVVGEGPARWLEQGGPPLGLLPDVPFLEERIDVSGGQVCVLVTDGITEAFDDTSHTARAVIEAAARGPRSAAAICRTIMTRALDGHGPRGVEGWEDDRTVVVVAIRERVPAGPPASQGP